jgi:hypothetical protein
MKYKKNHFCRVHFRLSLLPDKVFIAGFTRAWKLVFHEHGTMVYMNTGESTSNARRTLLPLNLGIHFRRTMRQSETYPSCRILHFAFYLLVKIERGYQILND